MEGSIHNTSTTVLPWKFVEASIASMKTSTYFHEKVRKCGGPSLAGWLMSGKSEAGERRLHSPRMHRNKGQLRYTVCFL